MTEGAPDLVAHFFRHEAGRLVATLTRAFGPRHLGLAEDVVQDALVKALDVWSFHGVPENPGAWLLQAARNRALDVVRREASFAAKAPEIVRRLERASLPPRGDAVDGASDDGPALDDEAALLFMCCHPEISREGRVALTLRSLGGFGVPEIARAFLSNEAAIAQRLVRAKSRIRECEIGFALPHPRELPERLDSVLEVLYLLFNEGYAAHEGDDLIRADLCEEAIRLTDLIARHPATDLPRVHALLALQLLLSARSQARVDAAGDLLRLREQDRSLWDGRRIAEGLSHLERSAAGSDLSEYHLHAGIAAAHAIAPSYAATDWREILRLYDLLERVQPTPVVALNRAVALLRVRGPGAALAALEAIADQPALARYYLLPATFAEVFVELGDRERAARHYRLALGLRCSGPERRFLERRLAAVEGADAM